MTGSIASFRERLIRGELLIGTFMKTPSPIVAEVLCRSPFDVVCIDSEHAPFGRLEVDSCVAALHAADRPSLVRVPGDSPHDIRNALDCGATGVLVPHVSSAAQAARIVRAAHFGEGGRGYAGSTRAAAYTTRSMQDHLARSRAETTVIVQIEDPAAVDRTAEIAAVDGIDAVFVGRVDLAVAMGKAVQDPAVAEQVARICRDARAARKSVGMYSAGADEVPGLIEAGASLHLLGSDHSLMLSGAQALVRRLRG
jgi:2-keto-3-deoxy-L-rhamnonate aldolase RhmA